MKFWLFVDNSVLLSSYIVFLQKFLPYRGVMPDLEGGGLFISAVAQQVKLIKGGRALPRTWLVEGLRGLLSLGKKV